MPILSFGPEGAASSKPHDPKEDPDIKRVVKHFLSTPAKPHFAPKRKVKKPNAKGRSIRMPRRIGGGLCRHTEIRWTIGHDNIVTNSAWVTTRQSTSAAQAAKPPRETESEKCENAISQILDALRAHFGNVLRLKGRNRRRRHSWVYQPEVRSFVLE